MTLTARERTNRRRKAARERGDCVNCCQRQAEPSKHKCAVCLARHRVTSRKAIENGRRKRQAAQAPWCDECIACGFHRVDCPTWQVAA